MPAEEASQAKGDGLAAKAMTPPQRERRARILEGARALLSERGYDGVTMRLLADRSGVAIKTLYDVYGSKEELLIESVKDRVLMVFQESEADADGKAGVSLLLHFVDSGTRATEATPTMSKAVAPLVARPTDSFGLNSVYGRCHRRALDDIVRAGELETWASIDVLLYQIEKSVTGTLLIWAKDQIAEDRLVAHTRLAVAEVLAPTVRGDALQQTMAIIKASYKEMLGEGTPFTRERSGSGGF